MSELPHIVGVPEQPGSDNATWGAEYVTKSVLQPDPSQRGAGQQSSAKHRQTACGISIHGQHLRGVCECAVTRNYNPPICQADANRQCPK